MCQPLAGTRVEEGEEWLWRGKQKIRSTAMSLYLGFLGDDDSMILYLSFFFRERPPDTLSSILLGKIRFSINLRFWSWPANWIVLLFTEAGEKHELFSLGHIKLEIFVSQPGSNIL